MRGLDVPHGVYVAVTGTDLIRCPDGTFVVLEDNLRVPSGASYMLANRQVMKRVFPNLFGQYGVRPLDYYGQALLTTLRDLAPTMSAIAAMTTPTSCCSRPASSTRPISSTPSWPARWASRWSKAATWSCTTTWSTCAPRPGCSGWTSSTAASTTTLSTRSTFRKDSMLGVPGLFNAYRAGNVTLANAIGTGVADDKAVYAYVPAIIRYYLGEEPILPNVETYRAAATTRSAPTCLTTSTNWWSRPWANRVATAC